jgi:hypothetical protein
MNHSENFEPNHDAGFTGAEPASASRAREVNLGPEAEGLIDENGLAPSPEAEQFSINENGVMPEPSAAEQVPALAPDPGKKFILSNPSATPDDVSLAEPLGQTMPEITAYDSALQSAAAAEENALAALNATASPQPARSVEKKKRARQNGKEARKKKKREAEEAMSRLAHALEREKLETERQRRYYESRLQELEQRLAQAAAAEETDPQNIASPKATFRIDLYAHHGEFQGKIEHLLTHDKRAFTGIDHAAISEFIAAHLPRVDSKAEELQKLAALLEQEEKMPEAPASLLLAPPEPLHEEAKPPIPAPLAAHAASTPEAAPDRTVALMPNPVANEGVAVRTPVRIRGMEVLFAATGARAQMLPYGQAFDLALELERASRNDPEPRAWTCQAAFFAKRIEGGARQKLDEITRPFAIGEDTQSFRVAEVQLPRGTYRVETLVNVHGDEASFVIAEDKFIQVY